MDKRTGALGPADTSPGRWQGLGTLEIRLAAAAAETAVALVETAVDVRVEMERSETVAGAWRRLLVAAAGTAGEGGTSRERERRLGGPCSRQARQEGIEEGTSLQGETQQQENL